MAEQSRKLRQKKIIEVLDDLAFSMFKKINKGDYCKEYLLAVRGGVHAFYSAPITEEVHIQAHPGLNQDKMYVNARLMDGSKLLEVRTDGYKLVYGELLIVDEDFNWNPDKIKDGHGYFEKLRRELYNKTSYGGNKDSRFTLSPSEWKMYGLLANYDYNAVPPGNEHDAVIKTFPNFNHGSGVDIPYDAKLLGSMINSNCDVLKPKRIKSK